MSSNSFSVSNEQLLLIEILNSMYNDNLRQINNFTNYISNLNESNTQIRNLLIQLLQNPNRRNNERRSARANTNQNNLGRIYLNNTPYIIDNVQQYRINTNRNYNRNYTNEISNTNFSRILQSFFQPVEVFPTQSQIEAATRRVRYCDIITPRNRSCPISLDNFEDNEMVTVIRYCGHIFRSDDLNTWFMSHCNCPVCRYDIRDYNSNASSEFFSDNGTETTNVNVNASSNQLPREQNNSSEPSIERNVSENLNERARNLRDDNTNVLNLFLDNISGNQSDIINNFTDASGNIFNNILNDTLSDPTVILSLLTALNNRSHR
jgi:hypothetical protein